MSVSPKSARCTMNKSTSRQVAVADIERLGPLGVIVIRLMMSMSDLTLASHALGVWNEEQRPAREGVKGAARRYFVRLQIAHLYEALKMTTAANSLLKCNKMRSGRQTFSVYQPEGSRTAVYRSPYCPSAASVPALRPLDAVSPQ